MKMYDAFAEDTWKVSNKLTVTAGVRYDIQLTPASGQGEQQLRSAFQLLYAEHQERDRPRASRALLSATRSCPVPVLRFGYGMFSALNQGSTYYADRVENGVVQINYNYTGCESGATLATRCPTVPTTTEEQFPNVPFAVTGPSLTGALHPVGGDTPIVSGPALVGTQSFHGLSPNFVPPLAHEAEFSIEQALPGKMSLSVGYVGTRALRLPVFVDANLVGQTPHGLRTYDVLNATNQVINVLTVPV